MNLLHRISYVMIVFTIIALVSGPGFAATVYFGNIGDQPQSFAASGYPGGSFKNEGPCKDIPNDADKGYLRDYIVQSATFFKLPPAFIAAVMKQESSFDQQKGNNGSSAGALGLMQLMPGTFTELNSKTIKKVSQDLAKARGYGKADAGLRQIYIKQIESQGSASSFHNQTIKLGTPSNDDVFNPKYNTFLGTAYYRGHYDAFKKSFTGNIFQIILAAYNAGPGAVQQYGGIPPYRETIDYVKHIMQYYTEYQGCFTPASSTGTAVTNANADKIRTNSRAGFGGQGCDSSGCYRADVRLLNKTFPGQWSEVPGPGATPQSPTIPPSQTDLDEIRTTLQAGNIPQWHVIGEHSGQHWILITGIDEQNNIEFHDPIGSGSIRTLPYNQEVTLDNGTKAAYFGIPSQGSSRDINRRNFTVTVK